MRAETVIIRSEKIANRFMKHRTEINLKNVYITRRLMPLQLRDLFCHQTFEES